MIQSTRLLALAKVTSLENSQEISSVLDVIWDDSYFLNRDQQLTKLSSILLALHHNLEASTLSKKDAETCVEMAETLINMLGIKGRHHPQYYMLTELQKYKVKKLVQAREFSLAHWISMQCDADEASDDFLEWSFFQAKLAIRCGKLDEAQSILDLINANDLDLESLEGFKTLQAEVLRNKGQVSEYQNQVRQGASRWEEAMGALALNKSFLEMDRLNRKGSPYYSLDANLEYYLWKYASKSRNSLKDIVKLENLKRRRGMTTSKNTYLYDFVKTIRRCYDADRPLAHRIDDLGEKLQSLHRMDRNEQELIGLLAAARWLLRSKAKAMAKSCLLEYKQRSLFISNGLSNDILNQLEEFKIE